MNTFHLEYKPFFSVPIIIIIIVAIIIITIIEYAKSDYNSIISQNSSLLHLVPLYPQVKGGFIVLTSTPSKDYSTFWLMGALFIDVL